MGPEDQEPPFDEAEYAEWLDMDNEERAKRGWLTTPDPNLPEGG